MFISRYINYHNVIRQTFIDSRNTHRFFGHYLAAHYYSNKFEKRYGGGI